MEENNILNFDELLDSYSQGADLISAALKSLSENEFNFKPAEIPDAWSIKEHIIHLTESEANLFLRIKFSIAEPGKDAMMINEEEWNKKINRKHESIKDYIELFVLLRRMSTNTLKGIDKTKLDEYYLNHPKLGKLTLPKMIEIFAKHPKFHLEYIERNKNLYKGK